MKIEIWSDYACPFCYIGEKRLEKALAEIDSNNVDIEFKSFELDPTASSEVVSDTVDRFAIKYGMSKEDAAHRIEQISMMGRHEGIDFKYATTRYTNTFDSLRLTKLAQERGHNEIITKLFDTYFTKNLELSNHHVLKKVAVECGLDENEVDELLKSDKYAAEVRNDEREASMLGIHGVPYFVIDGKYGLSGAQSVEVLKQAINEALAEEAKTSFNGMICGSNGCHFEG